MQDSLSRRITGPQLLVLLLLVTQTTLLPAQEVLEAKKPQREQIGMVLGKPVYRDEIRTGTKVQLRDELFRLFSAPAAEKYFIKHRAEIEPTEEEIAFTAAHFSKDEELRELDKNIETITRQQIESIEKQLAMPGLKPGNSLRLEEERKELLAELKMPCRSIARFMLDNWKFQKHLYDQYGGGRILWQQAGLEAFDAMHNWLKDQEKQGKFQINDPELHKAFYEYWTTHDHGAFLTDDPERIRKEFLQPEWAPKPSKKKQPGEK